jgi:hypothetical protein
MHPDAPNPSPTAEDRFDAWLDAFVAGSSTPAPETSTSTSFAPAPLTAAQSAALQFHGLAANAKNANVSTAPRSSSNATDPTWEKILMSQQSSKTPIAPLAIPITLSPPGRRRRDTMQMINTGLSIAAVIALLIAASATVWLNRDHLGLPGSSGDNDNPSQLAAVTPSADECAIVIPVTKEQAEQWVAEAKSWPQPAYLPIQGTATVADAKAAINTYRSFWICEPDPGFPQARLVTTNLQTNRLAVSVEIAMSPEGRVGELRRVLDLARELSPALVQPNPSIYVVDSNDPNVKSAIIPGSESREGSYAMFPEDFVILADGRIGAPLKVARPGGAGTPGPTTSLSPQTVSFVVFANVDGRWLFDESLPLCTANCDQYYAEMEKQAGLGTPTPMATPSAGPVSSRDEHS